MKGDQIHRGACIACGGCSFAMLFEVRGHVLKRCQSCGTAQLATFPSLEELEAIYSDRYFGHRKYGLDFGARREMKRRMDLLEKMGVAPGAKVLDAGCATGDFIATAGSQYVMSGYDVSEDAIRIAQERCPEAASRLHTPDLQACEEATRFDAIVMWDVLEHLPTPGAELQRLVQLLKPGGVLIISTPNFDSLTSKLMGKRWAFMTPPEHCCFFTRRGLRQLLQASGLQPMMTKSLGKWTSVGFVLYKLGRVFRFVPQAIVHWAREGIPGHIPIYIPTGDIMYVGARWTGYNDIKKVHPAQAYF